MPKKPAVNIESESIVETIFNAISGILGGTITTETQILEFPENAPLVERSIDDLSESDLAAIPESETPAAILPVMSVDVAAVYVFGVTLDLEPRTPIVLHLMPSVAETASVSVAADSEEAYTFLNDDGEEVTTVPDNQHVNVAAYLEPDTTYAPVITTSASSSDTDTDTDIPDPGDAGSGCNAFDSLAPAMMLAVMLLAKRRR